jgi:glucosyl-dolichyl phosphate glucuronosyltransferase
MSDSSHRHQKQNGADLTKRKTCVSGGQGKTGNLNEPFDISVIICTYNRCDRLKKSIESLLSQECDQVRYELIIVDNNSADQTKQMCQSILSLCDLPVRYIFEPQQGVSYARNAGIAQAKAPILAFSDDDVWVSKNWIASIKRAFDEHPEIAAIGGKVLPEWQEKPPKWLTRKHWTPLALQDYGDASLRIDADNPLCLITANLALRREVFEHIGLFSPTLQRVKNGIGSMEDHELHLRLWEADFQEMYVPYVIVNAVVQSERLTKEYHRKWYKGHGYFYALMRDQEFERSAARLFDVPAHLYKKAFLDLLQGSKIRLTGDQEKAFWYETCLCFFVGFFQQRLKTFRRSENSSMLGELASFLYSLCKLYRGRKVGNG